MAKNGRASSALAVPAELTSVDNRLDRARVSEIQRMRLLVAMAEVACERGAGDVSVAHVVERAGVSRRTFYEIFDGREECFLAALEEAIARAGHCVSERYDLQTDWVERIRSALDAVVCFLEEEPALGRLAVVESLGAGVRAMELRGTVIDRVVRAVDGGREGMSSASSATVLSAEGIVGGVCSVIHGRLIASDPGRLNDLINPLMSMIVLPYRGSVAAREELERPVAQRALPGPPAWGNPLKGLDMRLTYRTVRVLNAVADNPRSSNRRIGEASGVGDQGQISKLLMRLEGLGLVENDRASPPRGVANAWMLTERGEVVADAIAT